MAEKHAVTGYDGFVEFIKGFKSDKVINVLFTGEKIDGSEFENFYHYSWNFIKFLMRNIMKKY
jgi:hypothetical protein